MRDFSLASSHPAYRPDIDGLRAVAVLSVLVFHFFTNLLPGGVIGVDIFFVLSGFLISSIIFSSLEKDKFSIVEFYDRRIRRIFPALIIVLLACLFFGWFFFMQGEYRRLGKHVLAGSTFVSNFVLLRESGQLDVGHGLKPLIHLWSLAIEEQFYLAWPLLLAFVWKRGYSILALVALVALPSFAFNIVLTDRAPAAAFYSPLSRFWELMAGGLLAHIARTRPAWSDRSRQASSFLGAALLMAGLVFIHEQRAFPGWWALLPVAGTFMLIQAGPSAWINRHVLSHPALVTVGLISYPLYLWHWPLLSFARIVEGNPSAPLRLLLIGASFVLAWATWRLLETPLRFARPRLMAPALLSMLLVTGLVGYSCLANDGYPDTGIRASAQSEFLSHFDNATPEKSYFMVQALHDQYRQRCNFYDAEADRRGEWSRIPVAALAPECHTRDPARPRALMLWGDSHAAHLYPGLRQHLPGEWQVLQVTTTDCPPRLDVFEDSPDDHCQRSNWFALKTLKAQKPEVVILAHEYGHDAGTMAATEKALRSLGVEQVIFTGPAPRWTPNLPLLMARKLWEHSPRRTFVGLNAQLLKADQRLRKQLALSPNGHFVSLIDYFCDASGCLTYIGADKMSGIVSWDTGHLTPVASSAFARDRLVPLIQSLTARSMLARTSHRSSSTPP
ncbi:acyltransferase family protein [Azohydromonas caseinilytica]|uniref:Acyltransferase n=1 Tax=Azohydromonas caseinilytica TaxID=2728836 RepID=A0A848FJG5_9BURK|nr:acyltransferase family protein [Azohydromonas caseinilytica]NML17961.1 acyltransferase [Azohydromonas caseinilytica]